MRPLLYRRREEYRKGLTEAAPVGIGYFAVSFGFGALAASKGLSVLQATLISLTNVTSAGQFAGLTVMVAAGGLWELILTQLIINSRYLLMSLALTQRLGASFTLPVRMVCAFYNTDEIFALAMKRPSPLTVPYMLGLGTLPILGWTLGTLCGAAAGSLLPLTVRAALGMALYAMFVAIVFPQARQQRSVLWVVLCAAGLSCAFTYLPLLNQLSPGLAIVVCTVLASLLGAVLFPLPEQEQEETP